MAIRYQAKKGPLENARAIKDVSELEDDQEENVFGQKADSSIFGEAAKDLDVPAPIAAAARQQRDEAERAQGETVPAPQDQPKEAPPEEAPVEEAPDEPQGLFEDLGDIDTRQERERQAFADELESRRAEAMQQAQARAGLGGMGLSGATAALTSDIGRQEARAGDIAMADLARRQQQETFDELRRTASIWAFEEEFGVDLDGDGSQGNPEAQAGERPEAFSIDMTAEQAARGGVLPYGTRPPENSTLIEQGSPGTYDTYRAEDGRLYYIENEPVSADIGTQLRQAQRGEA